MTSNPTKNMQMLASLDEQAVRPLLGLMLVLDQKRKQAKDKDGDSQTSQMLTHEDYTILRDYLQTYRRILAPHSEQENDLVQVGLERDDKEEENRHEKDGKEENVKELKEATAMAMAKMWIQRSEYTLLPLVLVLQQPNTTIDSNSESLQVLSKASLAQSCKEHAAYAMAAYLDGAKIWCQRILENKNVAVTQEKGHVNIDLNQIHQAVLRCLLACAMALPQADHHDTKLKETADSSSSLNLDHDEAFLQAYLTCLRSIFELCYTLDRFSSMSKSRDLKRKTNTVLCLSERINKEMDGTLLAQLVHSTLRIMTVYGAASVSSPSTTIHKDEAGPAHSPKDAPRATRHNVKLSLLAVNTLMTMMQACQSHGENRIVNAWQGMFPGCFSGLFRVAMTQMQPSVAKSSSILSARAVQGLARLLECSVHGGEHRQSQQDQEQQDLKSEAINKFHDEKKTDQNVRTRKKDSKMLHTLNNAAMELARISESVSASQDSTKRIITKNAVPSGSASTSSNSTFFKELQNRTPGPLRVLLNLASLSSSIKLRIAVVELCHCLLVTTHQAWNIQHGEERSDNSKENETKNSVKGLMVAAMEACLVLQNDEHGQVAHRSRQILCAYKSMSSSISATHAAFMLLASDPPVIASRILTLLQEVSTLAKSGKEAPLQRSFDLIRGYLDLSLLSPDNNREEASEHGSDMKKRKKKKKRGEMKKSASLMLALSDENKQWVQLWLSSMADVLEVDLDFTVGHKIAPTSRPLGDSVETALQSSCAVRTTRYVHMQQVGTITSARRCLQQWGHVLGPNTGLVLLQDCVSQTLQECSVNEGEESRTRSVMGFVGEGKHVEWLQRSIGELSVFNIALSGFMREEGRVEKEGNIKNAKEEVVGAESNVAPMDSSSGSFVATTRARGQRRRRRETQTIVSTCHSLIPTLITGPLWNLPTTFEAVQEAQIAAEEETAHSSQDKQMKLYFAQATTPLLQPRFSITLDESKALNSVEVSRMALQGHAVLVSQLVQLLGHVVTMLGKEVQTFLPLVMHPLLEKVSGYGNHVLVQQSALEALQCIADALSIKSVSALLTEYMDFVLEGVSSTLGNGRKISLSTVGVVEVLLQGTLSDVYLPPFAVGSPSKRLNAAGVQSEEVGMHTPPLWLVKDVMDGLLLAFDRRNVVSNLSATSGVGGVSGESTTNLVMAMVRLFHVTTFSMKSSLKRAIKRNANASGEVRSMKRMEASKKEEEKYEPIWLDMLLVEFQKNDSTCTPSADENDEDEDAALSPVEGFAKHHNAKDALLQDPQDPQEPDLSTSATEAASATLPVNEMVDLTDAMLSRCCFFLSWPVLEIRRLAYQVLEEGCDVLILVFRNGEQEKSKSGDKEEHQSNPLLPQIHQIWPTLRSQLKSTLEMVVHPRPVKTSFSREEFVVKTSSSALPINSTPEEPEEAAAASIVFPCLLQIVSKLCEISGDFMQRRFEHDVWPVLANLLRVASWQLHSLRSQSNDGKKALDEHSTHTSRSWEGCLLPSFDCIARVFGEPRIGKSLSHIVYAVGTVVLPFLEDGGDVGQAAEIAMTTLLRIDCDCLWQSLWLVSGNVIIVHPLDFITVQSSQAENAGEGMSVGGCDPSKLVSRASRLMRVIDNLDEQSLDRC